MKTTYRYGATCNGILVEELNTIFLSKVIDYIDNCIKAQQPSADIRVVEYFYDEVPQEVVDEVRRKLNG